MSRPAARGKRAKPNGHAQAQNGHVSGAKLYRAVLSDLCVPGLVNTYHGLAAPVQNTMLETLRVTVCRLSRRFLVEDILVLAASRDVYRRHVDKRHAWLDAFEQYFASFPAAPSRGDPQHQSLRRALAVEYHGKLEVPETIVARIADEVSRWCCSIKDLVEWKAYSTDMRHRAEVEQIGLGTPMHAAVTPAVPEPQLDPVTVPPPVDTWHTLTAIGVMELSLFKPLRNTVFFGTTITRPLLLSAGVQVVAEDERGVLVILEIVNLEKHIPADTPVEHTQACADKAFPVYTRIVIAQPYQIINSDGFCVVVVRSPFEVAVGNAAHAVLRRQWEHTQMGAARLIPREYFSIFLEDAHCALVSRRPQEAIRKGLHLLHDFGETDKPSLHAVLLANRAQAALRSGDAKLALRDAAASLVFSPYHQKGWYRYKAALRALRCENVQLQAFEDRIDCVASGNQQYTAGGVGPRCDTAQTVLPLPDIEHVDAVLSAALVDGPGAAHCAAGSANGESTEVLRDRGNDLYRAGDYPGAIAAYTAALARQGRTATLADLLAALADSCLSIGSLHSALAVASASRSLSDGILALEEQYASASVMLAYALALLKRPRFALDVLRDCVLKLKGEAPEHFRKGVLVAHKGIQRIERVLKGSERMSLCDAFKSLVDYIGPVRYVADQGMKGLEAVSDMAPGTVVTVARPLVSASGSGNEKETFLLMGREVEVRKSQDGLSHNLTKVAPFDTFYNRVVSSMEHTIHDCALAPSDLGGSGLLSELEQTLSPRVLPLLAQWRQYIPACEHPELLQPSFNRACFQNDVVLPPYVGPKVAPATDKGSVLYPLLMAFNRGSEVPDFQRVEAPEANCVWEFGACSALHRSDAEHTIVVFTSRSVKAGERLTL